MSNQSGRTRARIPDQARRHLAIAALAAALLAGCRGATQNPGLPDGGVDARGGDPPADAPAADAPAADAPPADAPPADAPPVAPVLADLYTQMGPPDGGNPVTLRGDGFVNGLTVAEIGGQPLADVMVQDPTRLQGTAPAGTGFASATVRNGSTTATVPRAYYRGSWSHTGPSGGDVRTVLHIGSLLYATTASTVYRSSNGGADWVELPGIEGKDLRGLFFDPANPSRLFLTTEYGIHISVDGGDHWFAAGDVPGGPGRAALALAISPADANLALVATNDGIYRTQDFFNTWVKVTAISQPTQLAFSPIDPTHAYALTAAGIHRSTDGGATWTLLPTPPGGAIRSLAFHPTAAATLYGLSSSTALRSTDDGASWIPLGGGAALQAPTRIAIHPAHPTTLYVGTRTAGIFKSTDAGQTFVARSSGLPLGGEWSVDGLAIGDPSRDEVLATVGAWGIYRTTDGAASWTKSDQGLFGSRVSALASHPTVSGTVFASLVGGGLWKSTDHGRAWAPSSAGIPAQCRISTVAFHPTNPDVMLAGCDFAYRSTDGGATWTAVGQAGAPPASSFLFDPADPARVFAIQSDSIHRSLDAGVTWHVVLGAPQIATAIARSGNALLAATASGVLRSIDGGLSWAPYGLELAGPILDLAVDPHSPDTVYASQGPRGVLQRSLDGGQHWQLVAFADKVAFDPGRRGTIYLIGTETLSVTRSITGLETQVSFDRGLPLFAGLNIAVDSTGEAVYLGTPSHGLFRIGP